MTVDNVFDDRSGSAILRVYLFLTRLSSPPFARQVSIAAPGKSRYSRRMLPSRHIQAILAGLLLIAGISYVTVPPNPDGSAHGIWFLIGFLVGTPILLIGL